MACVRAFQRAIHQRAVTSLLSTKAKFTTHRSINLNAVRHVSIPICFQSTEVRE